MIRPLALNKEMTESRYLFLLFFFAGAGFFFGAAFFAAGFFAVGFAGALAGLDFLAAAAATGAPFFADAGSGAEAAFCLPAFAGGLP